MTSQSVGANAKSSSNFRSKPTPPTSNIITAPSRTVVKEPPPLFPPNPLLDALPKPETNNDVYLLRKSVSLKQLFRSSPFFLQPQHKTKDIERYSDRYRDKEPKIEVDNVVAASSGMFPSELISEKDRKLLRANLLKRKLPDVAPPILDVLPNPSPKKSKKKADSTKTKTPKTKQKKENVDDIVSKQKGTGKMDFQALEKLEEQEAKSNNLEEDEQESTTPKKKKTENDLEEEDNEQLDLEDADDNLMDEDDYQNLFDNDDVEDDYNDAGGSDGEPFMD